MINKVNYGWVKNNEWLLSKMSGHENKKMNRGVPKVLGN